jgi:hypothetical protein
MVLRILLSLAMLLPAMPAEMNCGDCRVMSVEECLEALDQCCNATSKAATECCEVVCDDEPACCGSECESSEEPPDACEMNDQPSTALSLLSCVWCCCCPMCPMRAPEPPPARVTHRSSLEKEKADCLAMARSIEPPPIPTLVIAHPILLPTIPEQSWQARLCIWRV